MQYQPLQDENEGRSIRLSRQPTATDSSAFVLTARQAILNSKLEEQTLHDSSDGNDVIDTPGYGTHGMHRGDACGSASNYQPTSARSHKGSLASPEAKGAGATRVQRKMAIKTIERYYLRHARISPDHLFLDAERTEQAEWGKLRFPGGQQTGMAAHYVRLSSLSTGSRVARLIAKYWKIKRPSVLISVTGGATSFKLSQRLEQAFSRGLLAVAVASNAIIFDGGTSAGVMSLVGSVFAASAVPIPLIGFVSWTKLHGRKFLAGNSGEKEPRAYVAGEKNNIDGAGLEYRHTHFIIADGGEGSGWGAEISLRNSVQQTYATLYNIPSVLIVVQGGPGTLRTIHEAIAESIPVVIIAGSGGAADAAVLYLDSWSATTHTSTFDVGEFEGGVWAKHADTLRTIAMADEHRLIQAYMQEDGGADSDIDAAILRAILRKQESEKDNAHSPRTKDGRGGQVRFNSAHQSGMSPGSPHDGGGKFQLDRSLRLAVQWGRVDVLRELLEKRENEQIISAGSCTRLERARREDQMSDDIQAALQQALEQARVDIAQILLRHRAELGRVNLCVLYSRPECDRLGLFTNSPSVRSLHALPTNLRRLDSEQQLHLYKEHVLPFLADLLPGVKEAFDRREKAVSGKAKLKTQVNPGTMSRSGSVSRTLRRGPHSASVLTPSGAQLARKVLRASDVFYWAVAGGCWDLALVLWRRTKNPVRTGLLACHMCHRMADMLETHRERLELMASAFEECATGILDEMPSNLDGKQFLTDKSPEWRKSLVEMAFAFQAKAFLSHPLCRQLADTIMHSNGRLALPQHCSSWQIILNLLCLRSLEDCTDLSKVQWEQTKRRLSFKDQRALAPASLTGWRRYREFAHIPKVKTHHFHKYLI